MLIDCAIYQDGKKIRNCSVAEIKKYSFSQGEFAWLAFAEPLEGEIEDICLHLGVHELALEDVRHGSQLPKMEEYDEHVFMVLKQINTEQESAVYLFAGPHYIVSVRKGYNLGFAGVRKRAERESKLLKLGPSYVVYAIMDVVVDRYFPLVRQLEAEVDGLEKALFAEDDNQQKSQLIRDFHQVKEKIRDARNTILPTLEFVIKLFGGRVPEMFEEMDNYFRDVHDHLQRLSSILDSLNETAASGVHTTVALIAIEDNRITKKLASWAAVFGASTFMAGIWGMNFKHMPELDWQYGYLLALSSIFTVAGLIYYKLKKSGWI